MYETPAELGKLRTLFMGKKRQPSVNFKKQSVALMAMNEIKERKRGMNHKRILSMPKRGMRPESAL